MKAKWRPKADRQISAHSRQEGCAPSRKSRPPHTKSDDRHSLCGVTTMHRTPTHDAQPRQERNRPFSLSLMPIPRPCLFGLSSFSKQCARHSPIPPPGERKTHHTRGRQEETSAAVFGGMGEQSCVCVSVHFPLWASLPPHGNPKAPAPDVG